MEKQALSIEGIPAVLWGSTPERLFIAVHGDQSHKEDEVIRIFAEAAAHKGWRTLSFDLPEHGDRKNESRLCKPRQCVADLQAVLRYARTRTGQIGFFGCSMGAYFGMLAYRDELLEQTLFLSPVVDMERIIQNLMTWFDVDEERLEREQAIETPVKTLYWDYYQDVLRRPVIWEKPTAMLYGARDTLCEWAAVSAFARRTGAEMTVLEDGEHFFHTDAQLAFLRQWLQATLRSS